MKKKDFRILRKSHILPEMEEMDSVKYARRNGDRRAYDVLLQALSCWGAMSQFRKDRERNKRYTYGDQWKDLVEVDGCTMTEEEYISQQGNVPLKNNLIRRLVRNVLGVYRQQSKEPTCYARDRDEQRLGETMTGLLQANMQLNRMNEVFARTMEEFLIGGFIVHRKSFRWRNEKLDCWTDYVDPNSFFIDSNMKDFRGWDVSILGEVHDVSLGELTSRYAKSPADFKRLREIYSFARSKENLSRHWYQFGYSRLADVDFLYSSDPTRCRVIEVWRREEKPRFRCHDYNNGDIFKIEIEDYDEMVAAENNRRLEMGLAEGMDESEIPLIQAEWMIDSYWYFYHLTPFGQILDEGETPYAHKEHPYVFKAYPFIDGEIHSFVADVIDQQRYTNRLITLYDFIMRASAKGVLLFPEGSQPDGYSMEDIAEQWSQFDGVIAFKPKPGVPIPQQIANNCTNIGISELLNVQLKFFEDISGVNGALQGKPGYSGMSASLYNQQTQNSTTSLLDLLESFSNFVKDGAMKDVKNIQQYYDDERVIKIVGKKAYSINPDSVRDADFDLSVIESTSTPAYRALANGILMQLWQAQAISVEMLLEHSDFPFADDLLQSLQAQKEQMMQGQAPSGLPESVMQQAQQGTDMSAVQQAENMLREA